MALEKLLGEKDVKGTLLAVLAGAGLGVGATYGIRSVYKRYSEGYTVDTSTIRTVSNGKQNHGRVLGSRTVPLNEATTENLTTATDEEELIGEQLSRNRQFFGEECQTQRIETKFVIVVGAGGVGSHAAHMLARSGVGKLRIIDFDNVTLSSLNRHAVAVRADVGRPKVEVLQKHIRESCPFVDTESRVALFNRDNAEELLDGNPDFVLDCIDDVNTKSSLIEYCRRHSLPFLVSLGAGGKADPTKIHIASLGDIVADPLANKIRWVIRKTEAQATQGKVPAKHSKPSDRNRRKNLPKQDPCSSILAIYSSEHPKVKLLPLSEEQEENPGEFGALPNFRVRVVPVLGTVPAIFGMTMATYVLCFLAGQPLDPEEIPRLSKRSMQSIRNQLLNDRTNKRDGINIPVDLTSDEVEFLVHYVWRQRSAISDIRIGAEGYKLTLTRWNQAVKPGIDNTVLVTLKEKERLEVSFDGHNLSSMLLG